MIVHLDVAGLHEHLLDSPKIITCFTCFSFSDALRSTGQEPERGIGKQKEAAGWPWPEMQGLHDTELMACTDFALVPTVDQLCIRFRKEYPVK